MKTTKRSTASWTALGLVATAICLLGDSQQVLSQDARANYLPQIKLVTQDNKEVDFYKDLIKDKTVLINVMYTRCDGNLCDQGTANLVKVQNYLGDRLGRSVFIY